MKEHYEDPPRWREHREQSDLVERTIGRDLRAIKTPAPLSGPQMARIAAGLRPLRPRHSLRWLVVAASLVLLVATAASAARLKLLPRWLTGASAPHPAPTAEPRIVHRKPSVPGVGHAPKPIAAPNTREDISTSPTSQRQVPASATSETQASLPTVERQDIPDEPVRAKPTPRRVSVLTPPPRSPMARDRSAGAAPGSSVLPVQPQVSARPETFSPPPPPVISQPTIAIPPTHVPPAPVPRVAMVDRPRPAPSPPAQQPAKPVDDAEASRLLADAIRLMRADGQPQSALALLDGQATRLNQSPYRHEALLIRVEALLALKRDADLLRLLDGIPLADVAASRTLLTTRGRLRAAAQRCAEAVADFDRALAEPGRKDRQALLGRALCREALGDHQGAQADRERYRQETSLTPKTVEPSGP